MRISLVGMSGSGKSFWSGKLYELGYKVYGCDDLIEAKLEKELIKGGYKGIEDVARWMGQPYEAQYGVNSLKYLKFEREVVEEILEIIKNGDSGEDIVIDTTGSVIYLENELLSRLKNQTKIVYLEVPQEVQDKMYQLYLKEPKPVIWGDQYARSEGDDEQEALKKNYPKLLKSRAEKYSGLADKVLRYEFHSDNKVNALKFIEEIMK